MVLDKSQALVYNVQMKNKYMKKLEELLFLYGLFIIYGGTWAREFLPTKLEKVSKPANIF